ncbi:DUF861 domain-containing protein [Nocardioides carbamazepini]|uniref:cupin domain-containing protein n=1 Tax=Nocardioides carbamazepini TaxID=2854259 RepID=UPI00214A5E24|nr:cupin domain-containing protein [Nocardioides carbamazepini]MCR1783994.1 DUF861 domain-containing protein [Nocardioides carbamazepini]
MTTPTADSAASADPAPFLDGEAVLRGDLPREIDMAPIESGTPVAYERVVSDTADGFFAVWACDAGVYPRHKDRRGSFMYFTEGAGTIVDSDGTTHELTAGSILVLPYSWIGHWDIRRTIRKVYLHSTPVAPLPTEPVPSTFVDAATVAGPLPDGGLVAFDGPDGRCLVTEEPVGDRRYDGDDRARFLHVLSGAARLEGDDGTVRRLDSGSVVALTADWSGALTVTEPLRLLTVITITTPAP